MASFPEHPGVEEQIALWRNYVRRRQAIHAVDVAELEDHLREQIAGLMEAGLRDDEAFLVAVKRMGDLDTLSREFAREHSERLWKQLMILPAGSAEEDRAGRRGAAWALGLAVAAAAAVKIPAFLGLTIEHDALFYARNGSLLVLPFLVAFFATKRALPTPTLFGLGAVFLAGAGLVNAGLFAPAGYPLNLAVLHLPIALWVAIGVAYAGGRWSQPAARMDFIRFSGEFFIYYVLIALGGGVLTGFLALTFLSIGLDPEVFIQSWLLPCGAAGAVVIGAWLVEAKQSVVENMAPVLTRLFTPLFTALLLAFLVAVVATGRGVEIDRDLLIGFDLLLVVVLGLLLYAVSARDPLAPPGVFDGLQVVLLLSALLADAFALWAVSARIHEFGFSPNRAAALGLNVVLLVNLLGSTWFYLAFIAGRRPFARLERWQTDYLLVYAGWALVVLAGFPLIFGGG
jgi:hypothetical protein